MSPHSKLKGLSELMHARWEGERAGVDPGFFQRGFKANVPGPKEWGKERWRGRVMLVYVGFLHFDFRGINFSNVRYYVKD